VLGDDLVDDGVVLDQGNGALAEVLMPSVLTTRSLPGTTPYASLPPSGVIGDASARYAR
jgi:hypothetical protein